MKSDIFNIDDNVYNSADIIYKFIQNGKLILNFRNISAIHINSIPYMYTKGFCIDSVNRELLLYSGNGNTVKINTGLVQLVHVRKGDGLSCKYDITIK